MQMLGGELGLRVRGVGGAKEGVQILGSLDKGEGVGRALGHLAKDGKLIGPAEDRRAVPPIHSG